MQKRCSAVDEASGESQVQFCREQYCTGTWPVRPMNQGKLGMIKEEMALKVAILAERFPPDNRWYVDVIVSLILYAGDYVSDDIWHRMVQIVSQQEEE